MFNLFKKIFKKKNQEEENISDINLACAIILLEVSYSDFEIKDTEVEKMLKFSKKIKKNFNYSYYARS